MTPSTSKGFGASVAGFANGNYLIGADGVGTNTFGSAYVFSAVPGPAMAILAVCALLTLLFKPVSARFHCKR